MLPVPPLVITIEEGLADRVRVGGGGGGGGGGLQLSVSGTAADI